ncbi:phage holin family protein [Devosia sp. XJ19-1]|uniref:Phage holin family protein n=1 Tax=Devosia ureilytica TaxID=2952754 RepID=A0A9Q4ANJ7_9HYPH|nr:phage holin family protein [Devosia ureilytica]MCP8883871.1 phage holin family protein [Devosia ureilytica]MCP8887479.1 phage holin family protein [Devosia ureilytica]
MSQVNQDSSLSTLLSGLVSDISGLFRKEIQLAKAETSEKVGEMMGGAVSLLIGGVLALGALGVLLSAIVTLVASMFVAQGMDPTLSNALAAGIVTIVVGIIAWMFISKGLNTLKASNLNLNRTTTSLGRDADMVKERL